MTPFTAHVLGLAVVSAFAAVLIALEVSRVMDTGRGQGSSLLRAAAWLMLPLAGLILAGRFAVILTQG